ncbi:MAG: fibronectin type III domain-containing protein, partial [Hyphomicrobiales bacterium]|nr:fibronectin type III domain-containing protein [Hyphomicrobiales bacterium]
AAPSSDGGSAITDYDVRWRAGSSGDWTELDDTFPSTALSVTISPLTNRQAYEVQVRAQNAQGESDWSPAASATPATTPAAPVLRITATRAMQILLGWSVPANGGSAIASYELQYRVSGGADNSWRSDNIVHAADTAISRSANTARIDQLTTGLTYEMRVRAVNAIGAGLWSAIATASPAADPDGSMTVGVIPATAPDAPPAPSIVPGNLQVTAIWQAPDDGGDAIRTYIVQWKRAGAPDTAWSSTNVHIRGTSAVITDLEEGAKYDVRVRAMNQIGASPWSPVAQAAPSFTQRSARAARANLARAGHVLAAGAVDVLGIRLVGEDDERRNRLSLAGLTLTPLPPSHAPSQRTRIHTHADEPAPRRVMGMAELLGRSNFELRLTPADAGQPSYQARLDPGGITLWGRGAMRGFQNETDTRLKLTGNAFSGWFGMDYAWRRATLGLAGSFNQSRTAFRSADAPDGDVTTRLGSFYPYLAIAPHERLRFWALAGFGWGSLAFEEK